MKILFLDIDGVLNSSRSVIVRIGPSIDTCEKVRQLAQLDAADLQHGLGANAEMVGVDGLEYGVKSGLKTVDPVCVALVNKLLATEEPIGLVLSSSHRRFFCCSRVPYGGAEHMRRLRLYLQAMGVNVPTFFSITGNGCTTRGAQVEEWLNLAIDGEIVKDGEPYVILDDSADFMAHQPLVLCDPDHGVSFANYSEASKLLGLKGPEFVYL